MCGYGTKVNSGSGLSDRLFKSGKFTVEADEVGTWKTIVMAGLPLMSIDYNVDPIDNDGIGVNINNETKTTTTFQAYCLGVGEVRYTVSVNN